MYEELIGTRILVYISIGATTPIGTVQASGIP